MDTKTLIKDFRRKLEDDLSAIGGRLTVFDPENRQIEVEVFPDEEVLREHASLLIKDALENFLERRDALFREKNPFIGLVSMYNKDLRHRVPESVGKNPVPPHII